MLLRSPSDPKYLYAFPKGDCQVHACRGLNTVLLLLGRRKQIESLLIHHRKHTAMPIVTLQKKEPYCLQEIQQLPVTMIHKVLAYAAEFDLCALYFSEKPIQED